MKARISKMLKNLLVGDLTCNYLENPLGMDSTPRFSWRMTSEENGQCQTAYRIGVSSSRESLDRDDYDIWDTGKIDSSRSILVDYHGPALSPRTRYHWKVRVWDKYGISSDSAPAYFQTGKLGEKWTANWITADFIRKEPSAYTAPYLRKAFQTDRKVQSASLSICGLGYFEARLNGEKIGDDVLSTAFTRYDSTVLYLTYDVTSHLRTGQNALGVTLGNGWYNCFAEDPWNTRQATWRHWPKLICELLILYEDGTSLQVSSDSSWKSHESPIVFNGIRNGEYYDANLEIPGWDMHDFDDTGWPAAKIIRAPGGVLKAHEMEPIRIIREMPFTRKWRTPQGTWIFDTGQNMTGAVRIKARGKAGTEITLRHSDVLNEDETLNLKAISGFVRSGEFQTDKYTKKSDMEETWQPKFVYHGFQYVEVEGLDHEPALDSMTALLMHTDFAERGGFECSDELLNTVQRLCRWSTVTNYHSIPTDCPHREKNGWTGDASLSSEQTLLNFAPMAAYTKWMQDFIDAQKPGGSVPCVVPSTGWGYNWGNGPDWSSALTVIPWYVYLYCSDMRIVEQMYTAIKKHCDYMESMAENHIVHYGIGDWCPPFEGPALSVNMSSFKAPTELTDTAYFYNAALTLSKMAALLGMADDVEYYHDLADKIKKAFRAKFFDKENMRIAGDCQTSTGCMLFQGLHEEDEKQAILDLLLKQIEEKDFHLDFGILGNKYVMHTLGAEGYGAVGFRMISQRTYPSFKRWIDLGATTLWECWNGGGSHNHHMFSDVSAFMYKYVGGISFDEENPGFRHILLRPAVDCGLGYSKCHHDSMYGRIRCDWTSNETDVRLDIHVPVGSEATLYLPARYGACLLNEHPETDGREVKIRLVSGRHRIRLEK
ncbi:MAG: family 78 glycoside hydrolase catalytic domain [Clostridia bacterium]